MSRGTRRFAGGLCLLAGLVLAVRGSLSADPPGGDGPTDGQSHVTDPGAPGGELRDDRHARCADDRVNPSPPADLTVGPKSEAVAPAGARDDETNRPRLNPFTPVFNGGGGVDPNN